MLSSSQTTSRDAKPTQHIETTHPDNVNLKLAFHKVASFHPHYLLCLPTPLTLVCGGSPIIPLLVHQPAYLYLASSSITPVGSVYKSRGDSVVRMWVQLKRWCVWVLQRGHSGNGCDLALTLCKYDLRKGDWLQTTQPTSGGAVTADSSCYANCVEPPHTSNGGSIYRFFGHADPLDGWRCCSQKRVMSRPIRSDNSKQESLDL